MEAEIFSDLTSVRVLHFIDVLSGDPSVVQLEQVRRWLKSTEDVDVESLVNFEGVNLMLELLEQHEVQSRKTQNHMPQVLLLNSLQHMLRHPVFRH